MDRDPARLAAAAARVQEDLRRTTGKPWVLSMGADYLLSITDGELTARVHLEREVEDADWFVRGEATPSELSAGLDADADEAVAYEVVEGLVEVGVAWPVCPDHQRAMGACSGWWYCEGEPYHDVAGAVSLQAG